MSSPAESFNLFEFPHKAYRGLFYELAITFGTTNWADMESVKATKAKLDDTITIYQDHNHHESNHIAPLLAKIDKKLADEWLAEHDEAIKEDEAFTKQMLEIVNEPDAAERAKKGREMYYKVSLTVAHHLEHMNFEETVVMPLLNKHFTRDELWAVHLDITKEFDPRIMQLALPYFLKYHNIDGRMEVIGIIKGATSQAPPEVWRGVCGLIRSVIPSAELVAIESRMGTALA